MTPTRPINLESGLRPTAAAPAVTFTGDRRAPQPRLEPDVARLRPLDRDAALRILIDEVKAALIERFGALPASPQPQFAAAHAAVGTSSLVSDLAGLLHALLADDVNESDELAQSSLELVEEAVVAGGRRAVEAIAQMPQATAEVRAGVEQMRWLLVRMVEVQARTVRAKPRRRDEENPQGGEKNTRLSYEVERDREDPPA